MKTPKTFLLSDFDFALAQLRHAYTHLKSGTVGDRTDFANGLLAPEIRKLERIRRDLTSGMSAEPQIVESLVKRVDDRLKRHLGSCGDRGLRQDVEDILREDLAKIGGAA